MDDAQSVDIAVNPRPPVRPTALAEEEQEIIRRWERLQAPPKELLAIIRRLDVDLLRARAEIDKLAPTVLALEEEKVRLDARVGELTEHLATWKSAYGDLEARYLANPTTPAMAGHCGHDVEGLIRERDALQQLVNEKLPLYVEQIHALQAVAKAAVGREIDVTAGEEREQAYALVMEWDDLAHAASHSMPWEQQRAMLVARIARAFAARKERRRRGK